MEDRADIGGCEGLAAPALRGRSTPRSLRFRAVVFDLLDRGYGVRFRATGRRMPPMGKEGEMITAQPGKAAHVKRGGHHRLEESKGATAPSNCRRRGRPNANAKTRWRRP